jgi:hypothetical protein
MLRRLFTVGTTLGLVTGTVVAFADPGHDGLGDLLGIACVVGGFALWFVATFIVAMFWPDYAVEFAHRNFLRLVGSVVTFVCTWWVGCWAIAESGFSSQAITDHALRRIYGNHEVAFHQFDVEWSAVDSPQAGERLAKELSATIACRESQSRPSTAGVFFCFAGREGGSDPWSKGIVLVSSEAEKRDTWQQLDGRWYIFDDRK